MSLNAPPSGALKRENGTLGFSWRLWVWKETKYGPSKLRLLDALGLMRITTGKAMGMPRSPPAGRRASSAGSTGFTRDAVTSKAEGTSPTTFSKSSRRSAPMPPISKVPRASVPLIDSVTGTVMGSVGGSGIGGDGRGAGGVGVGMGRGNWANAIVALLSTTTALAIKIDRIGTLLNARAVRLR